MEEKLDIFRNNQTVSKLSVLDQAILLFEIHNKYVSELGSRDCDIIAKLLKECDKLQEQNGSFQRTINALMGQIQEMEEQIPKWHLCSEELPTEATSYLCAVKHRFDKDDRWRWTVTDIVLFGTENNWIVDENKNEVIAWMELPKFEEVE